MSERATLGRAAETRALELLCNRGLLLMARNWRCRGGELDLVMSDGDTLVFVEVRYRSHTGWGGAAASVDARKRQRLTCAALSYLQQHPQLASRPCRFDVVALDGNASPQWIRNAFEG